MTEAEWVAGTSPSAMLEFIRTNASDRKARLMAVSSCERAKPYIEEWYHELIPVAESFADGLIDREQLEYTRTNCGLATDFEDREAFLSLLSDDIWEHVAGIVENLDFWVGESTEVGGGELLAIHEQNLVSVLHVQEIFGNPFRPVAFDPAWRTETAVGLASGIYEDRAFERMPILADALQDAGCEHADILAHCREPGVHVRGCWVVDLLLGKS